MAFSFIGISAVAGSTSGDITPAIPSGTASGDLLTAHITTRGSVGFSVPAGWQVVDQLTAGNTTNETALSKSGGLMAYIVRGASAPSTTFTRTGGSRARGFIMAHSCTAGNVPQLDSFSSLSNSSTADVTAASISTGASGELVLAALFSANSGPVLVFDADTDPTTASGSTVTTPGAISAGAWLRRGASGNAISPSLAISVADSVRATAGATGTIHATVTTAAEHAMIAASFTEVTAPLAGAASITEDADTVSATATIASTEIAGTASITEAPDTVSATGVLPIVGALAASEAADTVSSAGRLPITGSAALTEAGDTVSAVVMLAPVIGSASLVEAADAVSATGALPIKGALSKTEAADTASSAGALRIQATASTSEASDTVAGSARLAIAGSASIAEAPDTISGEATAPLVRLGQAEMGEAGDTVAATGLVLIRGGLTLTEDADTCVALGFYHSPFAPIRSQERRPARALSRASGGHFSSTAGRTFPRR